MISRRTRRLLRLLFKIPDHGWRRAVASAIPLLFTTVTVTIAVWAIYHESTSADKAAYAVFLFAYSILLNHYHYDGVDQRVKSIEDKFDRHVERYKRNLEFSKHYRQKVDVEDMLEEARRLEREGKL